MEDLFANPHSDIPDALWKSASPMERQLAAVEYWAELRGVEKTAGSTSIRRRLIDLLAKDEGPDHISAAIVGGLAGAESIYDSLKHKTSTDKERLTNEQFRLKLEKASIDEARRRGAPSKFKEDIHSLKKRIADFRSDHPALAAALQTAAGVGAGYGASRIIKKQLRGQ